MSQYRPLIFFFFLALIVGLFYGFTLPFPFIWDDWVMVVQNPLVRHWHLASQIFTTSAFGDTFSADGFYRPLQILTYQFDYSIWGLRPAGFRLTNMVLLWGSATVAFFIFLRLGFNRIWAMSLSLFFLIHPAQIEAVTYIAGRGDALYLFFSLLTILVFISLSNAAVLTAILLYGISVLCKENALPVALILLSYLLCFPHKRTIWRWASVLGGLLIMIGVLIFRLGSGEAGSGTLSTIAMATSLQRLFTVPDIIWHYARLFLVPWDLHMDYHFVTTTWKSWRFFFTTGFSLVMGGLWFFFVRRSKMVLFLGLWASLGFATVSQIIPLASTIREHWMLLSLVPVIALFGHIAKWLLDRYGYVVFGAMLTLVFLLWGGQTLYRNTQWKDPLSFYLHDFSYHEQSVPLANNIGTVYFENGQFDLAKIYFQKAVDLSVPYGYAVALNNLGVIFEDEGRFQDAVELFRAAIISNHYKLGYENLARICLRFSKPDQALNVIEEGHRFYPNNEALYFFQVVAYLQKNDFASAKLVRDRLNQLSPNYQNVNNLF